MATYTTLQRGSKGDEVKKLQTSLGITADGIFGSQTESAVKDYQKKNGLTVDGIVGKNTWGAINKASTTAPSTTPTATAPQKDNSFKYEDFKYTDPKDSDVVKQAEAMIQQQMANKPGQTQSAWTEQLNDTLNKILNREKFSYDLNGDALYQQYKDQYTTQGQLAMMDTMGQAAAMTGGYGNSYAQTVGQQTYQGYLQQLNDKVPELYQLALGQYNQEGQDLKDQAALISQMEQKDYDRGRDAISDYYTELQYLTDQGDRVYDREMDSTDIALKLWADKQKYNYDISESTKSKAYDTAMSMLALGVTPSAENLEAAGISSADAQAIANKVKENEKKAASSGSDSKGNNNSGNTPKALSVDDHDKVIAQLQAYHDSGDNNKLAGYLDSLVAAGTITEAYADTLYETYYVKKAGPTQWQNTKFDPNYGVKVTR